MSEQDLRIAAIDSRFTIYRRMFMAFVLITLAYNSLLFWRVTSPDVVAPPLMQFTRVDVTGPTALCPGETLTYSIELEVDGAGVFDIDVSVWRITPPTVALFSDTRRIVFPGPTAYALDRGWTVPDFYSSAVDGSPERWAAGAYVRRHAISTTSRSTEPSIIAIPFSIRSDCP